jgi:AraC family cel operon transcriptional repressor
MSIYNIAFPLETFQLIQWRYSDWFSNLLAADDGIPRLVKMDDSQSAEVLKATRQLSHAPRQPLFFDRFLTRLLCIIAQPIIEETLTDVPDWLQRACREISQPQHFHLGAKALVRLAGRCHEHVARELKKATGMTPTEYVNRIRLNYAAQTLEISEKPIIDIATECGFNSLGHFYQMFRKQYNMPPRLYRLRRHRVLPLAEK